MSKSHKYKRVPSFWWKFKGDNLIVVKSDSDKYPIVGIFEFNPIAGAEQTIEKAEKYIDDLNCGRIIPKFIKKKEI